MYRYMCCVSENGDKKVFYDTVAEIKKLYPGSTVSPYAGYEGIEMGQVLNISYRPDEEAKICIKYEYSKMRVVVLSEVYLSKYFEGKKVEKVLFQIRDNFDKKREIALSLCFLVVNIIASLYAFRHVHERAAYVIVSVTLAVIYIISAYKIKTDDNISYFRILAMQFGGYFTIPLTILSFALPYIAFTNDNFGGLYFIIIEIIYFKVVIPALIISSIAYAVLLLPLFETTDDENSLKDKMFIAIKNFFDRSTCEGIVFCGINIILAITAVFTDGFFGNTSLELMVYFVLILIYTISAVTIKRKNDISLFKILFAQSGEYLALVIFIVLVSIFSIGFDLNGTVEQIGGMPIYAVLLLVRFYEIVIPALAISGIITFALEKVNKSGGKFPQNNKKGVDNYESKNRYQTRN